MDNSVTTIVHHNIKDGCEEKFHQWLSETRVESAKYTGYLDSSLLDKSVSKDGTFISILRLDNYQNLKAWVNSSVHKERMDLLLEISNYEPKLNSYEGLEFWFDRNSPNLFKMSVVTYIGLLPLVLVVPPYYEKLTGMTGILGISISTFVTVLLMSYAMMPLLNRLLKRFL